MRKADQKQDASGDVHWRSSLVTRLVGLWALLVAGLVALFGYLVYRGGQQSLVTTWEENLRHDARMLRVKLQAAMSDVTQDVSYLSNTPMVRKFVQQSHQPEEDHWRGLVEQDFHALLQGKVHYFQVRLIGMANNGKEVVRLDRTENGIEVSPPERMQVKGDRDYFQEAVQGPTDTVQLSDINLNQDFGLITEPHIPTLRAARQVRTEDGRLFGIVIINVDLRGLFEEMKTLTTSGVELMLATLQGDYLIHPDAARRFGTDLRTGYSLAKDRPEAMEPRLSQTAWLANGTEGELALASHFPLTESSGRSLRLVVSAPAKAWLGGLRRARNEAVLFTALAAVAGFAAALFFGRWLASRLHGVTAAIRRYEAGADVAHLPPPGEDELGRLSASFRDMAAKVREQVQRLEAAKAEAEDATRTKEEFLAVMSHEIRTPMNSVTGLIHVLERNQPAAHQQPVLRSLKAAAANLLALVNDALDYTKLKAGRIDFVRNSFSLAELLNNLALPLKSSALQKGLTFGVSLAPNLPVMVTGDAVRLTQILNNLVSNAIKFTDHGRVWLSVNAADSGQVCFVIEDTGIGIPESEQARVFAPFEQVRTPGGRKFDGTGLGLSIARTLVEMQGGSVSLWSRPGEGSRFTVTLPLPSAGTVLAEPSGAMQASVPDFRGRRVLYIEDVASNREVMSALLEETGAVLDFAETGAEALDRLDRNLPELALVDLQLPDMTGIELAARIRQRHPALPMLAVTAQAGATVAGECAAAGISGVVLKPIDPVRLHDLMQRHFSPHMISAEPSEKVAEIAPLEPAESPRKRLFAVFPGQPERVQRVLEALAREFRQHEAALAAAFSKHDAAAVRRLRHQLHSALVQLDLSALHTALDDVVSPEGVLSPNPAMREACQAALAAAAASLESAVAEVC
ncbi:MAG: response regulator [Verrucomicrobiales bacterium]|nr:response regulator [Verrucomicrobiales bacterium]